MMWENTETLSLPWKTPDVSWSSGLPQNAAADAHPTGLLLTGAVLEAQEDILWSIGGITECLDSNDLADINITVISSNKWILCTSIYIDKIRLH